MRKAVILVFLAAEACGSGSGNSGAPQDGGTRDAPGEEAGSLPPTAAHLDLSFGKGGLLDVPVEGGYQGMDVVRGDDDSVYVVNFGSVVHLSKDGVVDTAFKPIVGNRGAGSAFAKGKLYRYGATDPASTYALQVERYLPNGTLDTTFGKSGLATGPLATIKEHLHDFPRLRVLSDGKVLLAASVTDATSGAAYDYDLLLFRFTADGAPDASFGTNGEVREKLDYAASALDVAEGPNGTLFVFAAEDDGALSASAQTHPGGVLAYTAAGVRDSSFAQQGRAFQSDVRPMRGARRADAGFLLWTSGRLLGLTSSGAPDPAYSGGPNANLTQSVAEFPGNDVTLVYGFATDNGSPRFEVGRFLGPAKDTAFAPDGRLVLPPPLPYPPQAVAGVRLSDGRLIIFARGNDAGDKQHLMIGRVAF